MLKKFRCYTKRKDNDSAKEGMCFFMSFADQLRYLVSSCQYAFLPRIWHPSGENFKSFCCD